MAAHDLRGPLNAVMAYAEFLLDETADVLNEEQRRFLTTIHESSEFRARLIDDLLEVARIESGELRLELVDNGAARISVADQGPGIEKKHLSRIFERFYRVDTARSRALGGTGLGLSIVKHIALAHQGNVTVETTLGRGTTFSLRLPQSTV